MRFFPLGIAPLRFKSNPIHFVFERKELEAFILKGKVHKYFFKDYYFSLSYQMLVFLFISISVVVVVNITSLASLTVAIKYWIKLD